MRYLLGTLALAGLAAACLAPERSARPVGAGGIGAIPPAIPAVDPSACKTGCSVGNHPIEPLAEGEFLGLVEGLADDDLPETERTRALEMLLFHGARTRELIAKHGLDALEPSLADSLRRELSRTHARLSLRIIDEHDVVRAVLDEARMPVGVKEHVHVSAADPSAPDALQPFEVSGTVHRTGMRHLWARL